MEEGQMLKQKSVTPISELRGCRATMERIACPTRGIPDEAGEHLGVAMNWLDSAIEKIEGGEGLPAGAVVPPKTFKECCFDIRASLQPIGVRIKAMVGHFEASPKEPAGDSNHDLSEMRANVMLAYRHLEDCRLRLGKAVQAYDGGTSCYPR